MALDYAAIAEDVAGAIAEVGRTVTITQPAPPSDPVTGAMSGDATPGTFTVVGPPVNLTGASEFDNDLKGDAALVSDDVRLLVVAASNAPFAPAAGDEVAMDGRTWRVIGVTPVAPDGTPLVYRLGLRA